MHIPPAPKAPGRKPCGNCEGCKREFGYQPCKSEPNPSKPIPPKARLIGSESSGFFSAAILALAGVALFMLGFITAMELVK